MDCEERIEELLGKEYYLIDIFPERVPERADGRYFDVEKILRRDMQGFCRRITNIILKLYCYCDMTAVTDKDTLTDPPAEKLAELTEGCLTGGGDTGHICILLPEHDSLLTLSRDDMYATLYAPDERLKKLVSELCRSEGLFFVRPETRD